MILLRSSRVQVLWLLAVAGLISGCGEPHEAGDPVAQQVVTDSAGIVFIENVRPEWGSGSGWSVDHEPVLRAAARPAT